MARSVYLFGAIVALAWAPGAVAAEAPAAGFDQIVARYRQVAAHGGWGALGPGPALRLGERSSIVPALRARLIATGDLRGAGPGEGDPVRYDASTARAVEAFQRRHGLAADGVLGAQTRAALDVPVEERIVQLEGAHAPLSVPAPARRWIRVNIPSFSLELIDDGRTVLAMPVIVGRVARPTPVFESAISSIVLHPAWTVPPDLAAADLVPKIRRDPGYLASRGFDVYAGPDPGAPRLDPTRVDWARVGRGASDVTLRQRPGSGNGLGRFLFSMENAYDVYLHDTPARELFRYDRRDFSSGCIRVADAHALAGELLRADAGWSRERLDAALAVRATRRLAMRVPVPVRVVYRTAWVDSHGAAQFRDDLYGEDGRTPAALRRAPAPARMPAPQRPSEQASVPARARPPRAAVTNADRTRPLRHPAVWPFAATVAAAGR
jgi:murein L,D-transpeptidase YcbB/YkuD